MNNLWTPILSLLTTALLPTLSFAAENRSQEKNSIRPTAPTVECSGPLSCYLKLLRDHLQTFGPLGKWQDGEIEVSTSPALIKRIENQTRMRLLSKGICEKDAENWSSVGIVAEDNYWVWVRDAVIFPSGVYGTYDRILWKSGLDGPPGVAIFPLLANKKIVVNVIYRHATRSWEIELPRGHKLEGESLEAAALRELKEETGYRISKCTLLGSLAPDSGVLTSILSVFYGEVTYTGDSQKDFSEAILNNPSYTKEEIKQGFGRGFIEIPIKGQLVKVQCRDPYLAFAILQAEVKGLI